jgi:hypothetical protein
MGKKLLIGILGNNQSGKSYTWSSLFNRTVRTGKHIRKLEIIDKSIPLFLINGAPLSRKVDLKEILPETDPQIVLCSFLYHKNVKNNFNYFIERGYDMYIQWLNPGFNDSHDKALFYNSGIINYLMSNGATVSIKNVKTDNLQRVNEIKAMLLGWSIQNIFNE